MNVTSSAHAGTTAPEHAAKHGIDEPRLGGVTRGTLASDNFTILSNAMLRDPRISFGAKGLFGNLASHRDGYPITEAFLAGQATDGQQKIRGLLVELRTHGYLYRGERTRYPAGTRNRHGKLIGGALGPYTWYVTDKPDEIAAILHRLAMEQAAATARATPPGDAPTPDNADLDLPPETTGTDDQGEPGHAAGRDLAVKPRSGDRLTLEDHFQKTSEEDHGPAGAGTETRSARPGPKREIPSQPGEATELKPVAEPQTARARETTTPVDVDPAGSWAHLTQAMSQVLSITRGLSPIDAEDLASKAVATTMTGSALDTAVQDTLAARPDLDRAAAMIAVRRDRFTEVAGHLARRPGVHDPVIVTHLIRYTR